MESADWCSLPAFHAGAGHSRDAIATNDIYMYYVINLYEDTYVIRLFLNYSIDVSECWGCSCDGL